MVNLTKEDIFETLKLVAVEQLGIDITDFTEEASFKDDLNADSLDLVELVMEMEDKFSVRISDEEAEKMKTVGQAVDFITERQ